MLVLLVSTSLHFSFKGYSTSGDLRCVLSTWPQFSEEPLVTQGVLDLVNVHQKVLQFLYKCLGFPPLLVQTDLVIFLLIGLDEVSSRIFFYMFDFVFGMSHRFNAVKSTGLKMAQKRCWWVMVLLKKV